MTNERWFLYNMRAIFLLGCVCWFFSCQPSPVEDIPEVQPEYFSPYQPEDNLLVAKEVLLGSGNSFSELIFSEASQSGGFYAIGVLNVSQAGTGVNVGENNFAEYYEQSLVRFDDNGNELWKKRPGFIIQRFKVVPAGILGPKEMIVLTGYDDNESNYQDESPDRSRIMLYDSDGTFIDNFSRDFGLSLYDLEILENTSEYVKFLGVGSVRKYTIDNNFYPGIYTFRISKASLEIDSVSFYVGQLLDPKWKHIRFWNLDIKGNEAIVSGSTYSNGEYTQVHLLKFEIGNWNNPVWWTKLSNQNEQIYHARSGMTVDDTKAYLCGYLEDKSKGTAGGCSGCYWASGWAASVRLSDGQIDWNKTLKQTTVSERFSSPYIYNGSLFLGGVMGRSWCISCSQEYTIGNGWLLKLSPANGVVQKSMTFGDINHRTFFNTLVGDNQKLWCIGQQEYTHTTGKGLLLGLEKGSL
ncbi:MAG: hypothetical protein IPL65_07755 [Lewinellaceae bacterium]|nr:hypothetical protein [Lewinellaceae bacterium]